MADESGEPRPLRQRSEQSRGGLFGLWRLDKRGWCRA